MEVLGGVDQRSQCDSESCSWIIVDLWLFNLGGGGEERRRVEEEDTGGVEERGGGEKREEENRKRGEKEEIEVDKRER